MAMRVDRDSGAARLDWVRVHMYFDGQVRPLGGHCHMLDCIDEDGQDTSREKCSEVAL